MGGTEDFTYNGWATFFGEVTLVDHHGGTAVGDRGFASTVKGLGPIVVHDETVLLRGKWKSADVGAAVFAYAIRSALDGQDTEGIPAHTESGYERIPATVSVRRTKTGVEVRVSYPTEDFPIAKFLPVEIPALLTFVESFLATTREG